MAPAPEINIKQISDIASGGVYAFGNQVSGTSSLATSFTVENLGLANLLLSGAPKVSISGTNASDFKINETATASPVSAGNSTAFTVIFSPTSVGAKTAQLSIANNDSNENPYLINLTGTGDRSTSSHVLVDPSFVYPTNILYTNYLGTDVTNTNSIEVARFIVTDGELVGGDADNLPTIVSSLGFGVTNAGNIERIALYDGTTEIAEVAGGTTPISFSAFTLTIPDNSSKTLSLRMLFKTTVTDNQRISFSGGLRTATTAGSGFVASDSPQPTSTSGDDNLIEVVADRLQFTTQPTNTGINTAMSSVVIAATDANGNKDLDYTGNVGITSTGTLTSSPVNVAFSSGAATFSSLTHTVIGTGLTLSATSTGLTGMVSNGFNITNIAYVHGDFRTKTSGTWSYSGSVLPTTQWEKYSSVNGWEDFVGQPNTNPEYTAYITKNTEIPATATAHAKAKIIITKDEVTNLPATLIFNSSSNWTFNNLIIEADATMQMNTKFTVLTSGNFEIKDGGNFIFNHSSNAFNSLAIFNGIEKFSSNSNFIVKDLSNGDFLDSTVLGTITTNSQNSYFGNIIVDYANGTNNFVMFTSGTQSMTAFSKTICNDLIFRTTNNQPARIYQKASSFIGSANPITIGGNMIIENTFNQNISFTTASHSSGSYYLKINKNFIHNGTNAFYNINSNTNNSCLYYLIIGENMTLGNNAKYIYRSIMASTATIYVRLAGNLTVGTTGEIKDEGSNASTTGNFWFEGVALQTIDCKNQSTNNKVAYSIRANALVKLINQNFALGTDSKLTAETSSTLDFGFDALNNALNVTGPSFESKTGSTLKITSPEGITSLGTASGNVRTTTARIYASSTPFADYHYIGKSNQETGNGLPLNVRNLVINNEGTVNDVSLTNNLNVNTGLTMNQGNIVSNGKDFSLGVSATAKGTLTYTSGFIKGTLKRWFNSTNTGNDSGLFPLGTSDNKNRFAKIEFTTATSGGTLAASISPIAMGNTGISSIVAIPAVGSCSSFAVSNTDDFYWNMIPSGISGNYTATVTKESTSTDPICEMTLLKRDATDWTAPGSHLQPLGTSGMVTLSRSGLSGFQDFGFGNKKCGAINTWNGTIWSGGTPNSSQKIVFAQAIIQH